MIKHIFLFIFSVFFSATASSQAYFNHRFEYGQPGWWDGATNIYQAPDGYVFGGGMMYYEDYMRLSFYKVDFEENCIFSKNYYDTADFYIGNPGSIINLSSDTLIVVGTKHVHTSNWVHDQGLLYFLNNSFDTLFTKYFGEKTEPFDSSFSFRQVKLDSDTNIIIVGTIWPQPVWRHLLLIKTDRHGNKKWGKIYDNYKHNEGHSVICTNDGGYAIGGFMWETLPAPNLSGDPVVLKTDSIGNQQWYHMFGSPFIDSKGMLCNTMDGNMVLGFAYCDSMFGGGPHTEGSPYRRINLIKLDNSGNIVWDKKYGESEYEKHLLNIRENPDGTLVSTGITTQFFPYAYKYVGWILKTDADGETIWYRQYDICHGESSWNYLYDVIQTNDKGYIACGVVYPRPPDTGSQDGWVIKVDSLGCEDPSYCWVGMRPETEMPAGPGIKLFPNPADKHTTLTGMNAPPGEPLTIRFIDVFGWEVKTVDVPQVLHDFELNVSQMAEGMYVVLIESQSRIIGKTKLIIRRGNF